MTGRRDVEVFQRGPLVLLRRNFDMPLSPSLMSARPALATEPMSGPELGALVLAQLELRIDDEPPGSTSESSLKPLYKLVDVKSWRAFANGTRLVNVWEEDGHYRISPSDNRKGLFAFRLDRIELHDPDPGELGRAIQVALERSTLWERPPRTARVP